MKNNRKIYISGFGDDNTEAVLCCLARGIRIVEGTVGALYSDELFGRVNCPFVLSAKDGSLATGDIYLNMPPFVEKYIINSVISCVKRNHVDGLRCSIVPLYSNVEHCQTMLIVAPIQDANTPPQNSDEDYARLESFVKDWIKGTPRMFV